MLRNDEGQEFARTVVAVRGGKGENLELDGEQDRGEPSGARHGSITLYGRLTLIQISDPSK